VRCVWTSPLPPPLNWLSIAYGFSSIPEGDELIYAYVQLYYVQVYLGNDLVAERVERWSIEDENPTIQAGFCCAFDNARFVFADASDDFGTCTPTEPLPLIEIVHSIEYGWRIRGGGDDGDGNGGGPVPEPGSLGLFGLVLAGLTASRSYSS
jgi:hypothetical protein